MIRKNKRKFDYFKIQVQYHKNGGWVFPKLEFGKYKTKNKFTTRYRANKWILFIIIRTNERKMYDIRTKGFYKKKK